MPPAATAASTTAQTISAASPVRGAGLRRQRQAGALQLRDEVQPADEHDQHARGAADDHRPQPDLREVGQRVRPAAPQRRGDQRQQHQVARGVADRVPQHVEPVGEDQPGDAEERCGREVLAADRGGVPARGDRPRGDVEVPGRPGAAQPERAGDGGRDGDRYDGRGRDQVPVSNSPAPDQVGEGALVAFGLPDRVAGDADQQPGRPARPAAATAAARRARRSSPKRGNAAPARATPARSTTATVKHTAIARRRWLRISDRM